MDYICLMVKYCIGRMRRVYFMTFPESKRDYKKSRIYYTISECAAQSIIQLAGGTFLAALLTYVGVSSGNIGVITSLVSLAAVSQIFAITIANRLKKFKLFVCIAAHFRILLAVVFFVPLLSVSRQCQVGLVVGLYLVAQIMIQIATPATQDWIASLVPYGLRGRYLSIKDAWVVIFLSVSTLLAGIILDVLKKDNILIGFVIVGILVLILALVNIITLTLMKEPKLSYVNSEGKEMHGSLARRNKNVAEVQNKECFIAEIKEAMNSVGFLKVLILNLYGLPHFILLHHLKRHIR